MAETPSNVKLGAAGAHLMEFSQQMQQQGAQEPRGPAEVSSCLCGPRRSAVRPMSCYAARCSLLSRARGGANRGPGDTLDARNFRGLKMEIWALFRPIALSARFREKVRSSFAVSGPISPARGVIGRGVSA